MKDKILKILNVVSEIKRDKLLNLLDNISDREMRRIISSMPEIGSCHSRGYFLIRTENDLNDSMRDLKSKATSIFNRANSQYKRFGLEFQSELLFRQ